MLEEIESGGIRLLLDVDARDAGVLVAFADRRGGSSKPPYDSLNLAATVGDDPVSVDANRGAVARAAGFALEDLVLAKQVHGCDVIEVGPGDSGVVGAADVLVSREVGKVIGILTADCVPVILHGEGIVAIAHAGWRGLVGGAIEAAIERVGRVDKAWVGPSIHACCYEVGPEVIAAFRNQGLPVADGSHVDPGRAAAVALHRSGVTDVESTEACTSCGAHYFSFRRDGVTGRQGAFTGLLRA